ncbi:PAS domain-containing protein [Aerosakkonemataceae cyanobacterium BLCC-F154]|uniref:histidine kinase n=1 Tax=Floridaenema fluviatile BLCC-F154 TaxID=3153640 RepID=A0ABV4YI23_9CYAN
MPSFRSPFLQLFPVNSAKIPLRWLLVVPFVLQTVGAVALVGYLSDRSGQQAVEKLAHQLMKNVGLQVTQELDRYLQNAHQFNKHQIAAVESGAIDLENLDRLHRYLILQHRQTEDLTTLLLGTAQGDFRVSHHVNPKEFGVVTNLKPGELPFEASFSNPSNPANLHLYSIDETGKLRRYLETIKNIDVRDRPWYRQAVKTGKAGWTSPFQIGSTNILAINAYTPFYNKSRQLLGVFAVNISLNQLSDFLQRLEVGKSGEVFIIERNGLSIADSTSETSYSVVGNLKEGIPQPGTVTFKRRFPSEIPNSAIQDSYQYLQAKFSNLATIKSPQALNFQIRGKSYFLNVSPYQDKYGLDWLVVTVIPESDFMAQVHSNKRTTVLLCLLTLGLAIASGLIIANRLTKPITRLNQVSKNLAAGDLSQRLPNDSKIIELQGLAQSFNKMAEQLQKLFQSQVEAEATRLSEAHFRQLATSIPGMIYTYSQHPDGSHSLDYVCDYSRYILELEPEQAIADVNLVLDQIHPDDRPAHDAAVQRSRATLEPFSFAFRSITPSGKLKWLEANSRPLRQNNGTITWYGILLDVSDRKQAEAQLKKSEANLKKAQEIAHLGNWEYNFATKEVYWSEEVYQIHGLDPDQSIPTGVKAKVYIHPDEHEKYQQEILEKFAQGESFITDLKIFHTDGSTRYIETRGEPQFNAQNQLIGFWGTVQDITDRKLADIARQESETRLRLALEVSGAVVWEHNLETDEFFLSKTVSLTNYVLPISAEKIPYFQARALVHPDDGEAYDRAYQEAIAQCGQFQSEHRVWVINPQKTGEWRWTQAIARVITDSTGKPTRMIGIAVDITDRRKLDTIKDEFLSVVSHELRTPLTSLRGSLGILESGVLKNKPDKAQRMLEVAVNNTDRLVRLVNDILTLQRLESGKVSLVKEVCQVSDLLEQAVESMQAIANQANITLEWVPLNASVLASSDEIIQALINLLGNAIKFSPPESKIWLKAEVTNNSDLRIREKFPDQNAIPTNYILFSITDQGRGIPPDKLESIFGRFQQVDSSDSRQKGGTGLGLAICKNIIQRHQGEIWVESAIDRGSTFYFTLPLTHAPV